MKHSVIKIKGKLSLLIALLMVAFLNSNNISAQEDEVVIRNSRSKRETREHRIRERDAFTDMKIEHKGDIRVSDDDKKIISISSGGYLKIYKKTFGNKRGIEIKSENGKLHSVYYSGNKKLAFEPEGSEWLAEILPEVIRKTGIDAETSLLCHGSYDRHDLL